MEILFALIGHVSYFIKVKCVSAVWEYFLLTLAHQFPSVETAEPRSSESAGEGKVCPGFG